MKYFIHCLAFFCLPLIIIRGVDHFKTTQKTNEKDSFVPTTTSKLSTLWIGKHKETIFVFTPHSNSKKWNEFNDKVTGGLINKKSLRFGFVYVINLGQEEIFLALEKLKLSIGNKDILYENTFLDSEDGDTPLYVSLFLQSGNIPVGHWRKFLFAFAFSEQITNMDLLQIVWGEEEIKTKKITCMRKQLHEFLQSPTMDYFSITNQK